MAEFLNEVSDDLKYGINYAEDKLVHPGRTIKELQGTGQRVINYGSDRVMHPSRALHDVENVSTRFIDDIISNNTHKLLLYAGILYFILSFQGFKNHFDKLIRSIPLVKTIYLFPHAANTALFVLLLYILKYKIDNDIVGGLSNLSRWIKSNQ